MIYTFEDGLIPDGFVQPSGTTNAFGIIDATLYGGQGAYQSLYCLKSGTITHGESSGIEVTRACVAGNIKFLRRVSSQTTYDVLRFYIDDVLKGTWSGNGSWAELNYTVTAGTHTFKWTYTKNSSISSNYDAAFIDRINIPEVETQQAPIPLLDFNFIPLAPDLNTILPKAIDFQFDLFAPLYGQYIESPKIDFTFTTNPPAIEQSASIEATAFTLSLESPLLNVIKVPALDLNFTFLASTQQRANPENVLRGFILTYPVCTVFAAHTATYESVPNYRLHTTGYCSFGQALHRTTYESILPFSLHTNTWGLTAQSLHTNIYQSQSIQHVSQLHESGYASTGLSAVFTLHESAYQSVWMAFVTGIHESHWLSAIRISALNTHDAAYASIGVNFSIATHENNYQSVGMTFVVGTHESPWSSFIRIPGYTVHEVDWRSVGTSLTLSVHTQTYASVGVNGVLNHHETAWASSQVRPRRWVYRLHEQSYASQVSARTQVGRIHEQGYTSIVRRGAFTTHEQRYAGHWRKLHLALHAQSYASPLRSLATTSHTLVYASHPSRRVVVQIQTQSYASVAVSRRRAVQINEQSYASSRPRWVAVANHGLHYASTPTAIHAHQTAYKAILAAFAAHQAHYASADALPQMASHEARWRSIAIPPTTLGGFFHVEVP